MAIAPRSWHFTGAFANTFKDLRDHPLAIFGTAAILAAPIPLAPVVAYFGVGNEIRFFNLRTSALAIALYLGGLLMTSVWTQFALTRATRGFAGGDDQTLPETLGSIRDGRGFLTFFATKLLYEGFKIVVLFFGFVPAIGVFLFALQGSGGRLERVFQGPVVLSFVLAILTGIVLALALSILVVLFFGLAPTVSALEASGPFRAFGRSRELLRGRKLDFFVLLFLRNLIIQSVNFAVLTPSYIAQIADLRPGAASAPISPLGNFGMGYGMGLAVSENQSLGLVLVTAVGLFLFTLLEGPLYAGTWANYYLAARGEEVVEAARASAGWRGFADTGALGGAAGVQNRPDPREEQNPSGYD